MFGLDEQTRAAVEACLQRQVGTPAVVTHAERLGGAAHDNWRLDLSAELAGHSTVLLRIEHGSPARPGVLDIAGEYELLRTLADAGLCVPAALWFCGDTEPIGRAFAILGFFGVPAVGLDPERLAQLLARVHQLAPEAVHSLVPEFRAGGDAVAGLRTWAECIHLSNPAYELAFRWLEQNAPRPAGSVLVHGDYHPGNVGTGGDGEPGLFDWDAACLADPALDVGALFSYVGPWGDGSWVVDGGHAEDAFLSVYSESTGQSLDRTAIRYWQVFAHVRRGLDLLACAAHRQGDAAEVLRSALRGRSASEQEYAFMELVAEAEPT